MKEEVEICNFCGVENNKDNPIIATNEGDTICYSCVNAAKELIETQIMKKPKEESKEESKEEEIIVERNPKEIKEILDNYVVGQEHAKKTLSVAVSNHLKRINNPDITMNKSNVIMIGDTGSGKTYLVQTLAKYLHLPLAISDSTSMSSAGYVGDDVETSISKLIQAADGNVELAQKGIVFIDEIDKIARLGTNTSISRDVGGESVQQGLLKIIEGSKITVPMGANRKNPADPNNVEIDTTNILFIVAGSFEGMIEKKLKQDKQIGFSKEGKDEIKFEEVEVETSDLVKFGMTPEFVGRLHMITQLESLSKETLIQILTEPKDAIVKQYQRMFELYNVKLNFSKKALEEVASKALERKTGARALRGIVEKIMLDVQFNISDYENKTITVDCIKEEFKIKIK